MIALISLIFFGILQLSQLLAAREVLDHAAARAARAKTVGFNRWMVRKVVDVATIPNAGKLWSPPFEDVQPGLRAIVQEGTPGQVWDYALQTIPGSPQYAIERGRIPDYLASENQARARYLLDYARWPDIGYWAVDDNGAQMIHVQVQQDYPLWVPMHRTFYADDDVSLAADAYIESHFPLYLHDLDW